MQKVRGAWLIPFAVIAVAAYLGNAYWGGPDGAAAGAGLVLFVGIAAILLMALIEVPPSQRRDKRKRKERRNGSEPPAS
jgi:hypothetical protein